MPIQESGPEVFPSSILHLKNAKAGIDKNSSSLFVFIPGNPGLIEFYEPFLAQIHVNNPEWEVLGISHAGMNTCNAIQCPVYSLQEQIDHKIEVINRYSWSGRPLIIMGHSVGAYMAQKIAVSSELTGNVARIGLLTPTVIDIHRSEKGRKLTTLNKWVPQLHNIAAAFSWLFFEKLLPTYFVSLILSVMMKGDLESAMGSATRYLVTNSRFVKQALGLAAEEMQVIRSDWKFQETFLQHCESREAKIWFLFSANDHWVSPDTRNDLIEFFKTRGNPDLLQIDVSPTLEHAFVRRHAKIVVREYFGRM
ncbi:LAME_0F09824g1_1 [Lachancea meyersii CBS 8951]|uniref:LAME_0F09824g1_1 n=1 Tax=Lachancea meyersii CBS 8951 TaxID=1266667 RepID=A0A1G4JV48_9SACH|nr:LAME_0F09824g1_1 [Lachancea meyersii CBS 8951]